MGTPDFSVFSLERLNKSKDIEITAVVTQPDKPRGRGQKMRPTPVKKKALELGIKVLQTKNVNKDDFLDKLRNLSPDFIVVVAFGQMLSKDLLNLPKYACINLHASLLPEYRGAGPIHQVILDGKEFTGITTMYMAEGWDTGDMIYKEQVKIDRQDTVGILHDKLADIGADLLVKTLIDIEEGIAPREKQNHEKATYASKIDKSTGEINWDNQSEKIYNQVRGVNPWPGAYTYHQGELLKIWKVGIRDDQDNTNIMDNSKHIDKVNNIDNKSSDKKVDVHPNLDPEIANQVPAGTIIKANSEDGLLIKTNDGLIEIIELQMAGRKRMFAKDFLHGYTIDKGDMFG